MSLSPHAGRPIRVAILGAGTVGREVVRAFETTPDGLAPADGTPLALHAVAVRDLARAAASGIPAHLLTDAPAHLVADPEVDVVVELIGGLEPARTLVLAALAGGKHVVTANKALIATHGPELEAAARASGTALRFEAAVGGGIPVLGPLASGLAANRLTAVRGIVNGTTNFILTAMADEGRGYDEVLADAQARGYAEADPTADVEGHDAVAKLVVLVRLAFGVWLEPPRVANRVVAPDGSTGRPGITGVTAEDVAFAAAEGRTVKLVARATVAADGAVEAAVLPTLLPAASALARTAGVLNRVELEGAPIGRVAFEGPGAGGPATSSAVLGDLLAIARGEGSTWAGLPPRIERSALPLRAPAAPTVVAPSGASYPVVE
ncbi:MAG TPA: homoserine dehydrogenase [Candidatus Limnocylindrales bacterium]|nr:homoserine dehydrogenase [Candidatus Limnocylindrales bacterium]